MGQILEKIFIEVINMGVTASVMIAGVFLVRLLLKKAPKIYSYILWSIVLFRLLCPVSFETEVSLLGALQNETSVDGRSMQTYYSFGMKELSRRYKLVIS